MRFNEKNKNKLNKFFIKLFISIIDLIITLKFQIQEKYTVGHRDFGIDKNIISIVVETCPGCLMKAKFCNGFKNGDNDQLENNRLPHVTYNGKFSSDARSMVANVPDNKCIWFDTSGTAISLQTMCN